MATKSNDFYIGIDLGTTNSSVAWGRVGANNRFNSRLVDMQLLMADDSLEVKQLLPSFVYLPKGQPEPVVGFKAKHMLKTQPSRVIRSVKTKLGKAWKKTVDGVEYTPQVVSSYILKQLLYQIKRTFRVPINDIVITVPASFDSEMRRETLEAAKSAGIKIKNDDGSPRNILLDEPRACLYDFVNRQKLGEIPNHIIDFSTKKTILVYDLGGGTLDVSMHAVNFNQPNDPLVNIDDIAISRFTDIGGDNFDEKLTDILFDKYIQSYDLRLSNYSEIEIELAKTTLFYYAEDFKRIITNDALLRSELYEDYDPNDIKTAIVPGYLLGQHPFSIELSLREYEEMMSEFLAWDIIYPTEATIAQRIGERNLISPIIDVLNKACKKTGKVVKPDLVLLSGGMTKLPMVQKRLEEFFGMAPQTIPDPDKAVSRGASIYHYYLHQGYKPTVIIAEPICIEVKEEKTSAKILKELVPAGVMLPYKSNEFEFKLAKGKREVTIPFYRSDQSHVLTRRKFKLSRAYPENTRVIAKVSVDSAKVLEFNAWVKGNPSEQIAISLDMQELPKDQESIAKEVEKTESDQAEIVEEQLQKREEQEKIARAINYKELWDFFAPIETHGKPDTSSFTERDIVKAKNIPSVVKSLIKINKTRQVHPKIKEKIILMLGDVASDSRLHLNYPRVVESIQHAMIRYVNMIQDLEDPRSREINTSVRYAIETIGKTRTIDLQRKVIFSLVTWVNDPIFRRIRNSILTSMGKLPPDSYITEFLVEFLSKPRRKDALIPALWALGKHGSRDLTSPVLIDYLDNVQETLLHTMETSDDFEIVQYLSYALLEISKLNRDHPEFCYSDSVRARVIEKIEKKIHDLEQPFLHQKFNHLDKKLRDWDRFSNAKRWLNLAIQALKGFEVAKEDMALLIEFRER